MVMRSTHAAGAAIPRPVPARGRYRSQTMGLDEDMHPDI